LNLKSTGFNHLKKALTEKTTKKFSKNHTEIVMCDITLSVRIDIFLHKISLYVFFMVYFGNLIFLYIVFHLSSVFFSERGILREIYFSINILMCFWWSNLKFYWRKHV
jgi:hypothetical protein